MRASSSLVQGHPGNKVGFGYYNLLFLDAQIEVITFSLLSMTEIKLVS